MYKFIALLLFIIFISGCAVSNISKDYVLSNPSDEGLIAVTVSTDKLKFFSGPPAAVFILDEEMLPLNQLKSIKGIFSDTPGQGKDLPDVEGLLYVIKLTEGWHQVTNWYARLMKEVFFHFVCVLED